MYNIYFSITSRCNQKCLCCPYTDTDFKYPDMTKEEIQEAARQALEKDADLYVVLSGGEPTLHPHLPEIISELQKTGASVHLLSNGELFSNTDFLERMDKAISWETLYVTTTIHSHDALEHEAANQTPGSFQRTFRGLHQLERLNASVIIKHCITGRNYQNLKKFYRFIDQEFDKKVPIYLCGIDYSGISEKLQEMEKVGLPCVKSELEALFDEILAAPSRKVFCSHIPLCWADPYYWRFLSISPVHRKYDSSVRQGQITKNAVSDSGTHPGICRDCTVRAFCTGTYYSAFQVLGNSGFKPYR